MQSVNMKISLKKFHSEFKELKALQHVVSGLSLVINKNKVLAVLLKSIPQNKNGIQSFFLFSGYYRQHIKEFEFIARPLYILCKKDTVLKINVNKVKYFEALRQVLTTAPLLLMPDVKLPLKLYIDVSGDGLGAALHQVHIVNERPVEGFICFIYSQMKPTEGRYGVIINLNSVKSLLNMKTTNRHMLRWKIAIQEYGGNMPIVHKDGNVHKNADKLSIWTLSNGIESTYYEPE
ncbi:hypothetical protein O181_045166 [Austropuccinia psidii MF-1]|uniref:Reverse transcriptase/retrotransposon-derived protein RNase H-like domain-containing protein n=1 Tax=Austropuccinia psidii MF-1 TaxID=1389203 RepID=A0A9Q3HHI1_9BASI|nr:hypothetical protein [Austropuccinia psidii MF-1]